MIPGVQSHSPYFWFGFHGSTLEVVRIQNVGPSHPGLGPDVVVLHLFCGVSNDGLLEVISRHGHGWRLHDQNSLLSVSMSQGDSRKSLVLIGLHFFPRHDRTPVQMCKMGSWHGAGGLNERSSRTQLGPPARCQLLSILSWGRVPLLPFFGKHSPSKVDKTEKIGYPYSNVSNLEDRTGKQEHVLEGLKGEAASLHVPDFLSPRCNL